jgi:hypothetical protein
MINSIVIFSVARDCGLIPRGDHVIQVVASIDSNDQPHVEFRHLPQGWLEEEAGRYNKEGEKAGRYNELAKEGEKAGRYNDLGKEEAGRVGKPPYHFAVDGASFEVICNHFRADLLPYLVVKASLVSELDPIF